MLRKDVKVGFIVGGILIATLIAYVMVSGKARPKAIELAEGESVQQVQPVGSEAPASESSNDGGNSPAQPPAPVQSTPAPSHSVAAKPEITDPFQPSGKDVWASALNTGTVLMSVTPSASGSIANDAGNNATGDNATGDNPTGDSSTGNTPTEPTAMVSTGATGAVSEPAVANSALVTSGEKSSADTVPSLLDNASPARPIERTQSGGNVAPRPTVSSRSHTVQRGETLTMIAVAAYGDQKYWKQIASANPNIDADKLKVGMKINLPELAARKEKITAPLNGGVSVTRNSKTEYQVQPGDSLHRIAQKLYGKDAMWLKIYELNKSAIGSDPARLKLHMKLKLPAPPNGSRVI